MAPQDEPAARPTLRSLADITGLGVSTVSQALRDSPEIAEETKRRVKLAAQQAGYRPNRAGVRLRTGKTNVIALILNIEGTALGLVEQLVYGISEALDGTGYHLVVTPYSLEDSMEPVRYVVETRSADGVIISRIQPDDPRVRYLSAHNMPFAAHGRTSMGIVHPFVDYDNAAYARLAVSMLAKQGRKRIALLQPPPGLAYHGHTLEGFAAGLREHGLAEFPLGDIHLDSSLEGAKRRAADIARGPAGPDGYVFTSELFAMAMIAGLEEGGKALGRDFDAVTKQFSPFIEWFRPGLMAVRENHRQAGAGLARAVVAAIQGEPAEALQTLAAPEPH
jgi:LacI family transcriptional regulator